MLTPTLPLFIQLLNKRRDVLNAQFFIRIYLCMYISVTIHSGPGEAARARMYEKKRRKKKERANSRTEINSLGSIA